MNKHYLFTTIFLAALVVVGGYFVFKIPAPKVNQVAQDAATSATIDTGSADTLGAEVSPAPEADGAAKQNMNDQLIIQDEVIGTGAEAVVGKHITVNYVGTLTDGTKFDSSLNPGRTPFDFNLGAGEVIQGWDKGFSGMKVGGKRKLTIPPSLGYGSADMGTIPPNSTLIFEVELLKVE